LNHYNFGKIFSLNPNAERNTEQDFIAICYEVKDFMKKFHEQDVNHKLILFECIDKMIDYGDKPYKSGIINMINCIESKMVITKDPIDEKFYKLLNSYSKDLRMTPLKVIFKDQKELSDKYKDTQMKLGVLLIEIFKFDNEKYNILVYDFLLSLILTWCIDYKLFINTCKLFFKNIEKIEEYILQRLENTMIQDVLSLEDCSWKDHIKFYCKKIDSTYCLCKEPDINVIESCK